MNSGEQLTLSIFIAGIILAILGYLFRRNEMLHTETQRELAKQSAALTEMLGRGSAYKDYPAKLDNVIGAVSGLTSRVDAVEEMHKEDINRIWEQLSPYPLRGSKANQ